MKQTSLLHGRDDKVSGTLEEELLEIPDTVETVDAGTVPAPEVVVIRSKKKADSLLFGSGFTRLVGVSYVASLSLIQDLFADGYEEIELVVGIEFSEELKKELKEKDQETVLRMARKVEEGRLRLYFPTKKPDHSKLFMLSRPGHVRILNGSANLTESARLGKQVNTVWVLDLPEDHPFAASQIKVYERENRKDCVQFMGDLVEELRNRIENNRTETEVVEAWLNRNPEAEEDFEENEAVPMEDVFLGFILN